MAQPAIIQVMGSRLISSPEIPTLGELLNRLGGVPADRVRFYPLPGTATVQDVIEIYDREKRLCELVDGVLVEKAVGYRESIIAGAILATIRAFVIPRRLGYVGGESGMMQLIPGLVRGPDVSFVSRIRLPNGIPDEAYPVLAPDLAVEVLSRSNTVKEMDRKRREYFSVGVRLAWFVDIENRTVAIYTTPESPNILSSGQTLDGGEVLPGFELPLGPLFAELDG
jgi:Uma2 family endonuclease